MEDYGTIRGVDNNNKKTIEQNGGITNHFVYLWMSGNFF